MADYIIGTIIILLLVFAIRKTIKIKKSGGCSGCSNCAASSFCKQKQEKTDKL
ncbi:MAG: FeoB-associated Cys-rich membrane protein [Anaerovorax sp.]|nr:FeoB-associated Cys-rich membrane protein [Anaerovorax sp.]